jgi:hypothetical protein
MRVGGGADNPANLDFTFPEIDEVGRHPRSGRARGGVACVASLRQARNGGLAAAPCVTKTKALGVLC